MITNITYYHDHDHNLYHHIINLNFILLYVQEVVSDIQEKDHLAHVGQGERKWKWAMPIW